MNKPKKQLSREKIEKMDIEKIYYAQKDKGYSSLGGLTAIVLETASKVNEIIEVLNAKK